MNVSSVLRKAINMLVNELDPCGMHVEDEVRLVTKLISTCRNINDIAFGPHFKCYCIKYEIKCVWYLSSASGPFIIQ